MFSATLLFIFLGIGSSIGSSKLQSNLQMTRGLGAIYTAMVLAKKEKKLCLLPVYLHNKSCFWNWKCLNLKTGYSVEVFLKMCGATESTLLSLTGSVY